MDGSTSGSTGFKEGSGGGDRSAQEWILAASTTYLFRLTFRAASAVGFMGVEFYEKTA